MNYVIELLRLKADIRVLHRYVLLCGRQQHRLVTHV